MRCVGPIIVVALSACGGDSGGTSLDDGELGGHCYPNGTCNVGLGCSAGVCLPIDAAVPDAIIDAPTDVAVDASQDAAWCSDDMAYEPNNTYQTAYDSGVAASMTSRTITGLAICPPGDRDHYQVTITTAMTNLEMIVDYSPDGVALDGSILNAGGVAIANATAVSGTPQRIRAYTPNLPTGIYYAAVSGPTSGYNNYTLTLNVTGP